MQTPIPLGQTPTLPQPATIDIRTIGYGGPGSGMAVVQQTDKTTGVLCNCPSGQITMNAASLAAGAIVSFTLTSNKIFANGLLILNHISAGTVGPYLLNAQCANGSALVTVRNTSAGALAEAIIIAYAFISASVT